MSNIRGILVEPESGSLQIRRTRILVLGVEYSICRSLGLITKKMDSMSMTGGKSIGRPIGKTGAGTARNGAGTVLLPGNISLREGNMNVWKLVFVHFVLAIVFRS